MSTESSQFDQAVTRIDAANAADPNVAHYQGQALAAELLYGQRMTAWLAQIAPGASEALRLAARCQHLRRWEIPRSDYPMTRPGYYQWRTRLGAFHAECAGKILREVGYDDVMIARVACLIRKENIKSDPEAQALEDVACLVFLENDYVDFARRHDAAKVIDILRKTWRKMSDRGHAAGLELAKTLPDPERGLIDKALAK